MHKVMTVGYLIEGNKILLGRKKQGLGAGKITGIGGKVEKGETPKEGFVREFMEECRIKVLKSERVGRIDFKFGDSKDVFEVHCFKVNKYFGNPVETEEMLPIWFELEKIPVKEMWADARHYMKMLLGGKKFEGSIHYKNQDEILEAKILQVSELTK